MQDDDHEDAEGNSLKAKAIRSFAGLVRRSERLVILLDPTYFERLWCVLLGDGRARLLRGVADGPHRGRHRLVLRPVEVEHRDRPARPSRLAAARTPRAA